MTIFIGIEACRRLGVYRQTPWKQLPLNQDMVLMVLLVAVGVALNNASLRANATVWATVEWAPMSTRGAAAGHGGGGAADQGGERPEC